VPQTEKQNKKKTKKIHAPATKMGVPPNNTFK
jgi:hypothetical protein